MSRRPAGLAPWHVVARRLTRQPRIPSPREQIRQVKIPLPHEREPIQYFGPRWDHPIFGNGSMQMPVPVGHRCDSCREEFVTGDRGYMEPVPTHLECALLAEADAMADVTGQHRYGRSPTNPNVWRTYRQLALAYLVTLNKRRKKKGMEAL